MENVAIYVIDVINIGDTPGLLRYLRFISTAIRIFRKKIAVRDLYDSSVRRLVRMTGYRVVINLQHRIHLKVNPARIDFILMTGI